MLSKMVNLYEHIVCENYSIIYVLPFPIEQDYPFKFLNSCIACKDI